MYSNKEIKQVYEKTDLVDVIGETVSLSPKGNLLFGICPFHQEQAPSFTVDPGKKRFHCYGCGAGGNVYSFVMKLNNCSFETAVDILAERVGLPRPENKRDKEVEAKRERLIRINKLALAFFQKKGREDERAMKYLKEARMLTEETIKTFGLGSSGAFGQELYRHLLANGCKSEDLLELGLTRFGDKYEKGRVVGQDYFDGFWDRIIFPIFNKANEVVGFGGRILGEGKPKYLNSLESTVFDKSHELYGLSIAKDQKKSFVLCEGYLDVISMHQAGFKTAVASLGTSLTFAQTQIIAQYTDTVFIAYDSDEPGLRATERAIQMLEDAGLKVFVISTAPYKDVDELLRSEDAGASEMKERFKKAVPGKKFLVQRLDKQDRSFYEKVVDHLL